MSSKNDDFSPLLKGLEWLGLVVIGGLAIAAVVLIVYILSTWIYNHPTYAVIGGLTIIGIAILSIQED